MPVKSIGLPELVDQSPAVSLYTERQVRLRLEELDTLAWWSQFQPNGILRSRIVGGRCELLIVAVLPLQLNSEMDSPGGDETSSSDLRTVGS